MTLKSTLFAAVSALTFALPAFAGSEITIGDAYARASGMNAMSGAAFMHIMNMGDEGDRLIAASSDIAKVVELHTHIETEGGVMQMRRVEDGFAVAAGEAHILARGGDHVMFMGLNMPMEHGMTFSVTLVFEKAGEVVVEITVDLERKPMEGGDHTMEGMDHGDHGTHTMEGGTMTMGTDG